ncbi:MAG: class I SAM-dependent methyltransferase [Lachnospiraceae bacterium]|nr:class I SAM-dependent methyltransferase [Lachnospiraceae bacterium]
MQAYSDFAGVYDELMDNVPYESWCENIAALIERYGISRPVGESRPEGEESSETENLLASERDLVLDLGCGTGTLTQMLHKRGYDMIGVDNSPEMLGIAMEKSAKGGGGILYLLQDMRELELYSTVGTVLSVCDSLNYLLEEKELLQVFRLVNNYLYPGGLFLFDFNTVYKYSQVIGDAVIAENREDCSFIWENYYHEQEEINEYDLTVFVQEEGEHFRRFVENHLQRGYTPQTMCDLVEQAGMQVIRLLDADTLGGVTDQSQRVYVLAREQGKPRGNMPVL